jgi:hypothetical protein
MSTGAWVAVLMLLTATPFALLGYFLFLALHRLVRRAQRPAGRAPRAPRSG